MTISKCSLTWMVLVTLVIFIACQPSSPTDETTDSNEKITEINWTTDSDQAKALFKTALHLSEMGNNQEARNIYTQALEKDPTFAMAYIHRAFTAASADEFAKDIKKAEAYQDQLSDPEKRILSISKTFLTADAEQELQLAKSFASDYPNLPRAHYWLGFAYQNFEEHKKARAAFQNAVELDPNWAGGLTPLGMSYIFNEPKDLQKAEKYLTRSLTLAPNNAMANVNMGDCYRARNNLKQALVYYEKATELDPKDPVAHLKAGHINSLLGNYDAARNDYKKSRTLSDFKASSINFEAFTYLYAGQPRQALNYLMQQIQKMDAMDIRASRMSSSKMFCMNSSSWIALHLEDAKHLNELLTMRQPVSQQIGREIGTEEAKKSQAANEMMWKGLVAVLQKDYPAAKQTAEEMKTTLASINDPNKLRGYHFLLGYSGMKEKDYQRAINHLQQADYRGNMYIKYLLAMAHEKAGNDSKSSELLAEIADYNFNNVGYALIRNEVKKKLANRVTS